MKDPRYKELANLLVHHSVALQAGETVLIEASHTPHSFIEELIDTATLAGGIVLVETRDNRIIRKLLKSGTPEQVRARWQLQSELHLNRMKKCDAYISVRGSLNVNENADIQPEHLSIYEDEYLKPVHFKQRVPHTKWVGLRWPNPSMAQQAGMSSEAFEDFYFDACIVDYQSMAKHVEPLKQLMEQTDEVQILGPGTDLRFSIKNIPVIPCTGNYNIPDGECFTAPVKDSVEGTIQYNTPSIYRGTAFDDICLTFKEGKVVDFSSNNNDALKAILDNDDGSRYLGEFALGFHPNITKPMRDILFDEKMTGSCHLAIGNSYEDADNGNRSNIHWDMVLRQSKQLGGGLIIFDGTVIREDGVFTLDSLKGLNPENI